MRRYQKIILILVNKNFNFLLVTGKDSGSGIYLFNPRKEPIDLVFKDVKMARHDLGSTMSIIQIFKQSTAEKMLKTLVQVSKSKDITNRHLFIEIQFQSNRYAEYQLHIEKTKHSDNSVYKGYVDDSLKTVERPIYHTNIDVNRTTDIELLGYFTYPCVMGGALREQYSQTPDRLKNSVKDSESFLGWANSNPIGCTFTDNNKVSFMIFRSAGRSDNKGVSEKIMDKHVVTTSFQLFASDNIDGVIFKFI